MLWCLDLILMQYDEAIAEAVIESCCDAVFVSFDGRREIHNRLRGSPKAFDKAKNGLQCLAEARRRGGEQCTITINFVLQPGNEREPENIVWLALEWGVDELHFQLLSNRAYTAPLDAEAAFSLMRTALVRGAECGLRTSVYPLPHPDENDLRVWYSTPLADHYFGGCTYVYENLRIDPEGNVIPCIEYKLGNILEQELSEIWDGSPYRTFRQKLADSGPFEACLRCCNMIYKDELLIP